MEQEEERFWWEDMLYNADEDCEHDLQPTPWGSGVRCTKCNGWFCF